MGKWKNKTKLEKIKNKAHNILRILYFFFLELLIFCPIKLCGSRYIVVLKLGRGAKKFAKHGCNWISQSDLSQIQTLTVEVHLTLMDLANILSSLILTSV
jgi:hypothetical protein